MCISKCQLPIGVSNPNPATDNDQRVKIPMVDADPELDGLLAAVGTDEPEMVVGLTNKPQPAPDATSSAAGNSGSW